MAQDRQTCKVCGSLVRNGLRFCPNCGTNLGEGKIDDQGKDPYQILQISRNAEAEIVSAAYKSLAKKYHPDYNKSQQADARMKDINWAFSILSDKTKRQKWDSVHSEHRTTETQGPSKDAAHNSPPRYQYEYSSGSNQAPRGGAKKSTPPPRYQNDGSRKPKTSRAKNSSSNQPNLLLVLLILVFVVYVCANSGQTASSQANTNSGVDPTPVIFPTSTPRPTATSAEPECISASNVRAIHVGRYMCIYGFVISNTSTPEYSAIIRFYNVGSGQNELLFLSSVWEWPDIERQDCILAWGTVTLTASYMYISPNEIYSYDYCAFG